MRKIYNKEIIKCYDRVIEYAFNLNDKENQKKFQIEYRLEEKYKYLISDKNGIANIQYLLMYSDRLLKDDKYYDYRKTIYRYKLDSLNILNKYE